MIQKKLMSLCVIGLAVVLTLTSQVNAIGIDDNEIEEYEEPVSTFNQNSVKVYYDYKGECSSNQGTCTNADACDELLVLGKNEDLCPQRDSNVVCCKKMEQKVNVCQHSHNQCITTTACGKAQTIDADDCPKNYTCCVLT